jgi:acetyltransferase-like isoleucine patch superfamily enzyme
LVSDPVGARNVRIHPTALIEDGVQLGEGTSVWDGVHIRTRARIGRECIVGEKTYIAYDVKIGDRVKLNAFVYICAGVTIEDRVMISAGAVFTNDLYPRATMPDGALMTSDPTEETLETVVRTGVTIGANATIGPGLELGEFSMVGMGAVVTGDVKPYELVVGSPARRIGWVCVCGERLRVDPDSGDSVCAKCHAAYRMEEDRILPIPGSVRP